MGGDQAGGVPGTPASCEAETRGLFEFRCLRAAWAAQCNLVSNPNQTTKQKTYEYRFMAYSESSATGYFTG